MSTYAEGVAKLVGRLRLAATFGQGFSFNAEGARALADLLETMAGVADAAYAEPKKANDVAEANRLD